MKIWLLYFLYFPETIMISAMTRTVLLSTAVVLFSALIGFSTAFASEPEFCWKDSKPRGVGTVPKRCAPGQEMIGLLCYDKCGPGMARFGLDCHSVCPSGMDDQGLFCRRSEYGRGAGYAWQPQEMFGEPGMKERCEKDHRKGNCEQYLAMWYPKCKPGYSAVGCCICRPAVPNCKALGLEPGLDLSCAKKVRIGSPKTGVCGSGQEMDAGLCYQECDSGFDGVGPVCWARKPAGWVDCGMGAAKDDATCAQIVFDQVSSVGQMAIFVGTLGTSSAGTAAAGGVKSATRLARMKKDYEAMKKAWNAVKNTPAVRNAIQAAETADVIKQGYDISQEAEDATTEEDMARVAAMIAAVVDPTGVASTVAAYTYPTCSKYFGDGGQRPSAAAAFPGPKTDRTRSNTQVDDRYKARAKSTPITPPRVIRIKPSGQKLARPSDLKTSCSAGPNTRDRSSTCPVIEMNGYRYWAHSYRNNNPGLGIVAYDPSGKVAKRWDRKGARYLWEIEVDSTEKTVAFFGQGNRAITMTWAELREGLPPINVVSDDTRSKSGVRKSSETRKSTGTRPSTSTRPSSKPLPSGNSKPGYITGASNTAKCLHKKSGGWTNGNPVHVWDCNVGSAENKTWLYEPKTGYIRGAGNQSKCLQKKSGGWANGNLIHVWDCNAGAAENKTWHYDPKTGYIQGAKNRSKCLHKKFGGWVNGNPIHVWDCSAGATENKTWTMPK